MMIQPQGMSLGLLQQGVVKMIKRILIALFCVVLLVSFTGSTLAVEKKTKDEKAKKEETKADTAKQAKKDEAQKDSAEKESDKKSKDKPAAKATAVSSVSSAANKQFDTFIDKNGNGIDDRRENLKNKAVTEAAAKKKESSEKKAETKKPQPKKKAETKDDSTKKAGEKKSDDKKGKKK